MSTIISIVVIAAIVPIYMAMTPGGPVDSLSGAQPLQITMSNKCKSKNNLNNNKLPE